MFGIAVGVYEGWDTQMANIWLLFIPMVALVDIDSVFR